MSDLFYDSGEQEKALIGFRYKSNFKVFSSEHFLTNPRFLGSAFAKRMARFTQTLRTKASETIFYDIRSSSDFESPLIKDIYEKVKLNDFDFIYFNNLRSYSYFIIPNENEEIASPNIEKYSWAYIYNFKLKKVEFYGRNFNFKYLMPSPIGIPYYASLNISSIEVIEGLCGNCYDRITTNYCDFLRRNHEQEAILYKTSEEI